MATRSDSPSYRIDSRKYPNHLHWQYETRYLGEDEHGLWLHLPTGTLGQRGSGPVRPIEPGFVALVPRHDPWVAEFYTSHPRHRVYVNIGTVPIVSGTIVTQIDLDLDVVLTIDGDVSILDEDEFAEHQLHYGYPPDLIGLALAGTTEATSRLTMRSSPFDGVASKWIAKVDPATLT